VLVGKGGVLVGEIDMGSPWILAYHSTLIWGTPARVARTNRRYFAGGAVGFDGRRAGGGAWAFARRAAQPGPAANLGWVASRIVTT
jgi:hypothetical protein